MTRGLGGPRVKDDGRVREAEGGFCAPVCKENVGANQRFRGGKDFSEGFCQALNVDQIGPLPVGKQLKPKAKQDEQGRALPPDQH